MVDGRAWGESTPRFRTGPGVRECARSSESGSTSKLETLRMPCLPREKWLLVEGPRPLRSQHVGRVYRACDYDMSILRR